MDITPDFWLSLTTHQWCSGPHTNTITGNPHLLLPCLPSSTPYFSFSLFSGHITAIEHQWLIVTK